MEFHGVLPAVESPFTAWGEVGESFPLLDSPNIDAVDLGVP